MTATAAVTTLAVAADKQLEPHANSTDLELRLLQAFAQFANEKLVGSYIYAKNSSRIVGFFASTTEKMASKTGLVALVGFFFAQFQRIGLPWVQAVDEAMGRRVIQAVVNLLLLVQQQQEEKESENQPASLETGLVFKLSYHERLQAMLQGEVPRLEAMLRELQQETKAIQAAPPVVVMELQDFVPKDEVKRLQQQSNEAVNEKELEVVALKEQLNEVERARQQLEQDLTDVHNYKESERGQLFQDMEEELARTKLEASQKAHDLRKLELVIEGLRKKRQVKSRSSRSNVSASVASSDNDDR